VKVSEVVGGSEKVASINLPLKNTQKHEGNKTTSNDQTASVKLQWRREECKITGRIFDVDMLTARKLNGENCDKRSSETQAAVMNTLLMNRAFFFCILVYFLTLSVFV